jgi:hypothetical protein
MASGFVAIREQLANLIRKAQARGDMSRDLDPDGMSRVMLGLYEGLVWQKVLEPDLDVMPYAQAVKAIFAANLKGGTDAAPVASIARALQH